MRTFARRLEALEALLQPGAVTWEQQYEASELLAHAARAETIERLRALGETPPPGWHWEAYASPGPGAITAALDTVQRWAVQQGADPDDCVAEALYGYGGINRFKLILPDDAERADNRMIDGDYGHNHAISQDVLRMAHRCSGCPHGTEDRSVDIPEHWQIDLGGDADDA